MVDGWLGGPRRPRRAAHAGTARSRCGHGARWTVGEATAGRRQALRNHGCDSGAQCEACPLQLWTPHLTRYYARGRRTARTGLRGPNGRSMRKRQRAIQRSTRIRALPRRGWLPVKPQGDRSWLPKHQSCCASRREPFPQPMCPATGCLPSSRSIRRSGAVHSAAPLSQSCALTWNWRQPSREVRFQRILDMEETARRMACRA